MIRTQTLPAPKAKEANKDLLLTDYHLKYATAAGHPEEETGNTKDLLATDYHLTYAPAAGHPEEEKTGNTM